MKNERFFSKCKIARALNRERVHTKNIMSCKAKPLKNENPSE